ncbi:hypothetical protein V6N13_090935 [Hibiscus sabdariffa]
MTPLPSSLYRARFLWSGLCIARQVRALAMPSRWGEFVTPTRPTTRGFGHVDARSRWLCAARLDNVTPNTGRPCVATVLGGVSRPSNVRASDLIKSQWTAPRGATGSGHDGALTLSGAPFQGTWARSVAEDASPDYNSDAEGDRFSSWAIPGSLAVTKGILAGFDNDPSAGSPTETLLRLLLPLNDKVQWTSRDVAGSEPPTSPRSEHFTGPFNRAGGTTRPIKARSASPAVGTSRPVLTVRRTGRPTPRSNYELFNCNNLNIRYWSWNYRGCWHQTCPPMDPR